MSKYNKTVADNGDIIYSKKVDVKKTAKDIMQRNTDIPSEISRLKGELEDEIAYRQKISSQAMDPRKRAERGVQFKGRIEDLKTTQEKIDKIIRSLRSYGVRVRKEALVRGKIVYEGGHVTMFNSNDIKRMKLDVFEDNSRGVISNDLRDYMLITLESVSKEIERVEAYNEAVDAYVSDQREKFVDFIRESYNVGLISDLQKEVMLEMAEDDFIFEAPNPDMIPELVSAYIEAAKEGNEDKKGFIKEQIEAAKELKNVANGSDDSSDDVVTEGTDCSILEKLESLKVKLTDEERATAERFDELIANGGEVKSEEPKDDKKKEDPEEVDSKKEDKPEDESENVPEEEGGSAEGEQVKESVVESVSDKITTGFESVVLESSITDADVEGIMNYVAEAVEDSVYSEEDKARIERLLKMR